MLRIQLEERKMLIKLVALDVNGASELLCSVPQSKLQDVRAT